MQFSIDWQHFLYIFGVGAAIVDQEDSFKRVGVIIEEGKEDFAEVVKVAAG